MGDAACENDVQFWRRGKEARETSMEKGKCVRRRGNEVWERGIGNKHGEGAKGRERSIEKGNDWEEEWYSKRAIGRSMN